MEERADPDGNTLYVAHDEGDRGSKGPFFVVYAAADRTRKYGWACGNCESLETAMDSMGRVVCNDCGNLRKPTEWDAAHE